MSLLSEEIVTVASRYLGPEARRFMERQALHLEGGVTFDAMGDNELDKFAWWVGISAKLIMDKEKAKELSFKIAELRNKMPSQRH